MQGNSARQHFLRWARKSAVPIELDGTRADATALDPLCQMVGDASVVALSEAVHGAAESLEYRNQLFKCLVEQKGFTSIAIESGSVEARRVHDYVRGATGSLGDIIANGISWTFDRHPQNLSLVRWLRECNADERRPRKINFYGFDVPGSPGNVDAKRGINTALSEALQYVRGVDGKTTAALDERLESLMTRMGFDFCDATDTSGYGGLSRAERDQLTATVSDLVTVLETREAEYTAVSTSCEYEWAYRAAIGARQVDGWLRQILLGLQSAQGAVPQPAPTMGFLSYASDVRDRAQADNLAWILQREGPGAKTLVFAHRFHLSMDPMQASCFGSRPQTVMGTYLRRCLGSRLVTVCNLVGKGEVACGGVRRSIIEAPRLSIDGLATEVGMPVFLLDLRSAPRTVATWLREEHVLGQGPLEEGDDLLRTKIGNAFDILFYIESVTPANSPNRASDIATLVAKCRESVSTNRVRS
jgi:erythromycin esterase